MCPRLLNDFHVAIFLLSKYIRSEPGLPTAGSNRWEPEDVPNKCSFR